MHCSDDIFVMGHVVWCVRTGEPDEHATGRCPHSDLRQDTHHGRSIPGDGQGQKWLYQVWGKI